ncbi:hypothetical protein [Mucilaginibacter sp. UYCu711]|uniref:hypothetical protein n=1 Tax=Mucilaginibacter sp. UYCu711 TaxID=3156339 RepID=UPI003D19BA63
MKRLTWIAWWTLNTVAIRVIMVWLFNNMGKSIFAMALFHMILNLGWQSFPINGSFFDPCITELIMAAVTGIVVILGRPRNLDKN